MPVNSRRGPAPASFGFAPVNAREAGLCGQRVLDPVSPLGAPPSAAISHTCKSGLMEPGQTRTRSATFHAFSDTGVHMRSKELRSYVTRQRSPDGRGADPKLSHALLRQGQGVWESA